MLQRTFVHAPGIGRGTEQRLWDAGARTWEDFLELRGKGELRGSRIDRIAPLVEESRVAFFARDARFFGERLPSREQWRLFPDFRHAAAFVDIETTGLSPGFDQITVVGLFDGERFRAFVRGRDLEEFPCVASRYPLLVTYNGAQFDIPFLQRSFPGFAPVAHLDLRFPLASLGFRGGLKQIERQVGIERPGDLQGVDGFEAVRLWHRHLRGDRCALDRLVAYTEQDVENLLPLADLMVERTMAKLGVANSVI
jgi:uncharacterized protein YprB with RNaseH-like and TPR domain